MYKSCWIWEIFSLPHFRAKQWWSELPDWGNLYFVHPFIFRTFLWTCAVSEQRNEILQVFWQLLPCAFIYFNHHLHFVVWQCVLVLQSLAVADRSLCSIPLLDQLHLHPQIHALRDSWPNQHVPQHLCQISTANSLTSAADIGLWCATLYGVCAHNFFFWSKLLV